MSSMMTTCGLATSTHGPTSCRRPAWRVSLIRTYSKFFSFSGGGVLKRKWAARQSRPLRIAGLLYFRITGLLGCWFASLLGCVVFGLPQAGRLTSMKWQKRWLQRRSRPRRPDVELSEGIRSTLFGISRCSGVGNLHELHPFLIVLVGLDSGQLFTSFFLSAQRSLFPRAC